MTLPVPQDRFPAQADPHVSDLTGLNPEDREFTSLLFEESMTSLPEHTEKYRDDFAHYVGQTAASERAMDEAMFYANQAITRGQDDGPTVRKIESTAEMRSTVKLEDGKIGWLSEGQDYDIPLQAITTDDDEYLFGSIINLHPKIEAVAKRLEAQGSYDSLMHSLVSDALPTFLKRLEAGSRQLRPVNYVSKGSLKQRNVATSYNAYKINVQGTNNRALLLLPPPIDERKIIILAALYDHEDQRDIISTTSLIKQY